MNEAMSIELLEATHVFPGAYTFKVIGRAENDFEDRMVTAVRTGLAQPVDPAYTTRLTAGGQHISLTFRADVETAEQVLSIYRHMQGVSGLVMLW